MQSRPNISLLKNNYLETYHAIQACLMQHNFSLLLPRNIEKQIFDIVFTAQNQKVPTKKLECNKDLDKFCNKLIYEYNSSVSAIQQVLEGIFTFSILVFFFTLLDVLFEKGVLMSTLITCILISIGYFISNTILRHKETSSAKLRSLLIFGIVLIPFMIMSFLKTKIPSLAVTFPFLNSLILTLITGVISFLSYSILSKKYDLFIFIRRK